VPPVESGQSELFPYVAIDFTAPANGDCIPITVTTINGLSVGDTISIGTGFYTIDSFVSDTVVQICNDGDGILPGTSVIAQDQFGNYQYPIYVTSSCCVDLSARVDVLETTLDNLSANVYDASSLNTLGAPAATINSGNASISINNTTNKTMRVMVSYNAFFSGVLALGSEGAAPLTLAVDVTYTLAANVNGGGAATVVPVTQMIKTYTIYLESVNTFAFDIFEAIPVVKTYTLAPTGVLTISNANAGATVNNLIYGAGAFNTLFQAQISLSGIMVGVA
jgi:hypothetical protein